MSRSKVPYDDPCTPPATPPITTKSTPPSASACSAAEGSKGSASGGTLELPHPSRPLCLPLDPLLRRMLQVAANHREVVAVVDRVGVQGQFLAHQVEQRA